MKKSFTINLIGRLCVYSFLLISFVAQSQTVYKPAISSTFIESTWKDPNSWIYVSGDVVAYPNNYPQGTDEVQFGNGGNGNYEPISIGFDLTTVSSTLTFSNQEDGPYSLITVTGDGTVVAQDIVDNSKKVRITVEEGGSLTVTDLLTLSQTDSEIVVKGEFYANNGLTFSGGGKQTIDVHDTGFAKVTGTFTSQAGDISIADGGELEVTVDIVIPNTSGSPSWTLNGILSVGGDIDMQCWVSLSFSVGGDGGLNVDGSCDMNSVCNTSANNSLCGRINNGDYEVDLPVTLVSFTGQKLDNSVELEWVTATELNAERFDIQSSFDNRNWVVEGSVLAAGNSSTTIEYNFTAQNNGEKYYRLVQYDFDGRFEVFGPLLFDSEVENKVFVYPNILDSGNDVSLFFDGEFSNQNVNITLMKINGQFIFEKVISIEEGSGVYPLQDIEGVEAGFYLLRFQVGATTTTSKLIIR
ncbi:T9SS type A sorting domain-containing protein [Flammeovirga agarivorans]|uniref:T9SS type A sorting domain-containing protein n=1 Tax=Flammeovirga agarivorans TaxID=2726742 RepID=A0A7X8SL21_9BACT|nr:T9SS type A sorting domain-containing protein [Flammeovirga agarivorans]NLR92214.1 T9SS type A sorting domain-containing protein [Flammeovirga agarivorans]